MTLINTLEPVTGQMILKDGEELTDIHRIVPVPDTTYQSLFHGSITATNLRFIK